MGRLRALFVVVVATLLASCASPPQIQQLPAYVNGIGLAKPDEPKHPRFFVKSSAPAGAFDDLVPYAQVQGLRNLADPWTASAVGLARRLIRVMPDAMCYFEGAPEVAGVVSTHVGFGVSTGSTVQFAPATLQAFRVAPSRMPFEMHPETDVVVSVRDKAAVGALTEGDTLTSIGGWNLLSPEPFELSALARRRLELHPGDKLEIEWVRSGVGKMSGYVSMLPVAVAGGGGFAPAPLLADEIVRVYQGHDGIPFWGYYNPHNPYGN